MLLFIQITLMHLGLVARKSIKCGIRPKFKFLIFDSVIQSGHFILLNFCFLICKFENHESNNIYLWSSCVKCFINTTYYNSK